MSDPSGNAKAVSGDQTLTIQQLIKKLGMSESWVHLHVRRGTFPKPLKSTGASRWSLAEVEQWIADQKRKRDKINEDW
jgi:predicted DNA-binding transcriptional regulator AlpA